MSGAKKIEVKTSECIRCRLVPDTRLLVFGSHIGVADQSARRIDGVTRNRTLRNLGRQDRRKQHRGEISNQGGHSDFKGLAPVFEIELRGPAGVSNDTLGAQ